MARVNRARSASFFWSQYRSTSRVSPCFVAALRVPMPARTSLMAALMALLSDTDLHLHRLRVRYLHRYYITLEDDSVRADRLDRDLLLAMRGAGFKGFAIGVESGSEKVLALVKKGETIGHLEQAVALSCELGFEVGLFFVIGLPGDTLEATEKSLAFAMRYPVRYVYFWNFFPFPKTEAYEWVRAHGTFLDPESYLDSGSGAKSRPLFHTPEFPLSDRKKAISAARKVSAKINRSAWEGRLRGLPAFARGFAARAMMSIEGSNALVWLVSRIRSVLRHGRTPARMLGRGEVRSR